MSTEQDDKAVRDAIAGAEIGEARPAMTTKRPWTEGPWTADLNDDGGRVLYYTNGLSRTIAGVYGDSYEAHCNAHLIAVAPAMYEALDAAVGVINQLYQKLGTVPADELADITATVIGITAALRAANPDTFDGEGE